MLDLPGGHCCLLGANSEQARRGLSPGVLVDQGAGASVNPLSCANHDTISNFCHILAERGQM